MNKKLKGFTLVELIVVMAIIGILMAGVMQMFKPVRTIYVDSTQYEAQRTAQTGVVQYITETVRYATDMGIYTNGSATSAISDFAAAYCTANNIDSGKVSAVTAEIGKYAEVIVIDNKTTHYSKDYTGRVIRRKVDYTTPAAISTDFGTGIFNTDTAVTVDTTKGWRTALGEAYYGENSFQISITVKDGNGTKPAATPPFGADGTGDEGMLNIDVYSTRNGKRDISQLHYEEQADGSKVVKDESVTITDNVTRGAVFCRNLATTTSNPNAKGVANAGVFDVSKYTVSSSSSNTVTCIVFLNKDGKDKVVAVS